MPVVGVLDVLFTLGEMDQHCIDHIGHWRIVVQPVDGNLAGLLEESFSLVAESERRSLRRRYITECAYGSTNELKKKDVAPQQVRTLRIGTMNTSRTALLIKWI